MSVKTEAIKPAAEISLFDAFGPKASEQVKAINQGAAELSMDDMALVMGAVEPVLKKPLTVTVDEEGLNSWQLALQNLTRQLEDRPEEYFSENVGVACGHGLKKNLNAVGVSTINPRMFLHPASVSSKGHHVVQSVIESASSNMQRLLDVGVDSRSFEVSIRYADPQTGAPRTLTLDDDSTGRAGFIFTKNIRTKKLRRSGRDIPSMVSTAKK